MNSAPKASTELPFMYRVAGFGFFKQPLRQIEDAVFGAQLQKALTKE